MAGRRFLFPALYFAQGVPWGFVTVTLMVHLLGRGLQQAALGGLVALATLPWTCKPLVGPLIDRAGRRRPIILAALAAMAVSLAVLARLDPGHLAFSVLLVVHNACAAIEDVATDALALDALTPDERGRINGAMFAGKWLGTIVGGSALSWLAGKLGFGVACGAAVALLVLPAVLVLGLEEAPVVRRPALRAFFTRSTLVVAPFLLISGAGDSLLYPVLMPLLRGPLVGSDGRFSLVILIAGATSALGALAGGRAADAAGRPRLIVGSAVLLAAAHLAWAAAPWTFPTLVAYEVVASVASGALGAATLGLCMDLTDPRLAATQFQVFMALASVRTTWATALGGLLAGRWPAPVMWVVAATIELLPLTLLAALRSMLRRA